MPGVVRVLTGEELQRLAPPVAGGQLSLPAKWRTHVQHAIHNPQQPMLAVGKVRHVGEAIAVVVAESRYQALDAAELVAVDIEPLAAVVDVEAALAPEIGDHPRRVRDQPDRRARHRERCSGGRARRRAPTASASLLHPSLCRHSHRVPRRDRRP